MHRFKLVRDEDATGISGTGEVAEGVMFYDGSCALRWRTRHKSTAVYPDIPTLMAIHGHAGKTRLEWIDEHVTNSEPNSFMRGCRDAMQDNMENCHFASVGGSTSEPRWNLRAPEYIAPEDRDDYMRGYEFKCWQMYGEDWRTCDFSWAPALTINGATPHEP